MNQWDHLIQVGQDSFNSLKRIPPEVYTFVALVAGPLVGFFSEKALLLLLAFLIVDLLTGMWKARTLKKLNSHRLRDAFDRAFYYLLLYALLHSITLYGPALQGTAFLNAVPEVLILTGFILREALSILENLATIRKAQKKESPLLDSLITRLGMDQERIMRELATGSTDEQPVIR